MSVPTSRLSAEHKQNGCSNPAIIGGIVAIIVACIGAIATILAGGWVLARPQTPIIVVSPLPIYVQPTQLSSSEPVSTQLNVSVATPIPENPTQPPANIPSVAIYPQLSLPFIDNFDNGYSSEWRILNGQPIVTNGYLGSATDNVALEIGNNSLANYTVSFDYKDTYNGTWLGGVSLIIAQKIKFDTQGCPYWLALVDNKWTKISECNSQIEIPGKLRLTVNGNTYRVYVNGTPFSEITYGKTLSGPFSIYVEQRTLIDNLSVTSP